MDFTKCIDWTNSHEAAVPISAYTTSRFCIHTCMCILEKCVETVGSESIEIRLEAVMTIACLSLVFTWLVYTSSLHEKNMLNEQSISHVSYLLWQVLSCQLWVQYLPLWLATWDTEATRPGVWGGHLWRKGKKEGLKWILFTTEHSRWIFKCVCIFFCIWNEVY